MGSTSGDVRRSTVNRASYVSRDEESSLHAWKCEGLVKWILFFSWCFPWTTTEVGVLPYANHSIQTKVTWCSREDCFFPFLVCYFFLFDFSLYPEGKIFGFSWGYGMPWDIDPEAKFLCHPKYINFFANKQKKFNPSKSQHRGDVRHSVLSDRKSLDDGDLDSLRLSMSQ